MIYAIGDIHGQQTMLRHMLKKLHAIPLQEEDTILFIGDYIDRGEDSRAVIDMLLELRAQRPNTVFLRGNHEQLILDARKEPLPSYDESLGNLSITNPTVLWLVNGGETTLKSYASEFDSEMLSKWPELIPREHWNFLEETRMEYSAGRYFFVHAGILPEGKTWEGQTLGHDERIWIREPFLSSRDSFGGRIVVFGHTPHKKPRLDRNKVGIDTGAVFGGPLTAVGLNPSFGRRILPPRIIQVEPISSL